MEKKVGEEDHSGVMRSRKAGTVSPFLSLSHPLPTPQPPLGKSLLLPSLAHMYALQDDLEVLILLLHPLPVVVTGVHHHAWCV